MSTHTPHGHAGSGPVAAIPVALLALLASGAPTPADAQYFGRNKVQYEQFDFRVMETEHFDLHFYPEESLATRDAGRMAERWYERFSRLLGHRFDRRAIVFYANHPDFQQTNVIRGQIAQGTGGVTEGMKNRIVMPFTGVYADNDHVLGHEIVHVFQYNIAGGTGGTGAQGLGRLPLWVIEGMAEYLSLGREDPHTAMWLRDAALRNDLPTIRQLSTDPRYFPYRYGQAMWAYVAGRWGDQAVGDLFRASMRQGFEPAMRTVLGMTHEQLSTAWHEAIRAHFTPAMVGRAGPSEAGDAIIRQGRRTGDMNVSPALSPDGRWVAFLSSRGLFGVDLYVADARTGRVVHRLTSPNVDRHFDALSFINSAGSWSPDARKLAFVVFADGDNEIAIFDVESRNVERRIAVRGVGAISDPAWGPDGRIAFSGITGGISDLYLLDLATERVEQLTNDRHADLQPAWSPDGRTLAFASDRGAGTDFELLTHGPMRIALLDLGARSVRLLGGFESAKHINPQFSADGADVYFISDREGFSDIYRARVASGEVFQVTRLATGVSGITTLSPALSVARQNGRVMFSVFEDAGYSIFALDAARAQGEPVVPSAGRAVAGVLPPEQPGVQSIVAAYLDAPRAGLPPNADFPVVPYRASLQLDYIGAAGTAVGVGVSRAGAAVGGGIATFFSDMLGNRVVAGELQAMGTFKDVGAQAMYQNLTRRWNWGVGAAHIPYLTGFTRVRDTTFQIDGQNFAGRIYDQILQRIYFEQLMAIAQYPFSSTRRVEISATGTYQNYDNDLERLFAVGNQVVGQVSEDLPAPKGIGYAQGSAALVGDYSYFGFTSPVAGGRYRFEAGPTFGTVNFQTLLADYRRYFFLQPVTVAFRGIHYGRYGSDAEDERLSPLYIGHETFVRGYAIESFDVAECSRGGQTENGCPEFDRLVGSRIGVLNAELRVPLFGTEQFGLINFSFLPTELSLFGDAGVAWTSGEAPDLTYSETSAARVPVFSAGVSARFNVLGYLVVEAYYAKPFQRPLRDWHFGFQIAPGW